MSCRRSVTRSLVSMRVNEAVGNRGRRVRRWPRHAASVGKARSELRAALNDWGLGALEDTALVVVSELVTNAVRHARTSPGREIETRYVRDQGAVRIEVHDAGKARPTLRAPGGTDTAGRGLILVAALATSWGVDERTGPGKCVWAVVRDSPEGADEA
ncbi:ATP-binding protein [Streptomyces sp. NPDC003077]|uniref:ATP-binding protein n=1 Tax=Streptomyces sp. NPDC003077 TaxID=3154443 RepID=UPI0033A739C1